jgi:hypothetical protein
MASKLNHPFFNKNRRIRRKIGQILLLLSIFSLLSSLDNSYSKKVLLQYNWFADITFTVFFYIIPSTIGALLFISVEPNLEGDSEEARTNVWYKVLGYIFVLISILTIVYSRFEFQIIKSNIKLAIQLFRFLYLGIIGAILCFHEIGYWGEGIDFEKRKKIDFEENVIRIIEEQQKKGFK